MPRRHSQLSEPTRPRVVRPGLPGGAFQLRVPSYRLHKPSGHAVVTLAARDHYLGRHGTPASWAEYQRLVAEWVAGGCPAPSARARPDPLVSEVVLAYWRHVEASYDVRTRDGTMAPVLRRLRRLYQPKESGCTARITERTRAGRVRTGGGK